MDRVDTTKTSRRAPEATVAKVATGSSSAIERHDERRSALTRRFVLISGNPSELAIEPGDVGVLDRRSIGRKTLTRLVAKLASAGAAGLVLNDDVMSDIPLREREALSEQLPLLLLGPEHPSTALLEPVPPAARPAAVLRAILRGGPVHEEVDERLDLTVPTRAVVVVASPVAPLPAPKLEELVAAEAVAADPRAVVTTLDGTVVALLRDYNGGEAVENMARTVHHRARSALKLSAVTVGVGRKHVGLEGLRRTYREALWAANASQLLWGGDRVTSFRDLGIYGMLEPFLGDSPSADTEDVEKLIEHDGRSGGALLPTLEAFFELCSVGETASRLYVHRNTVRYRLRAVKRITGLDVLGDPDARVFLEVQMRLAKLRGLLPSHDAGAGT